MGAARDLWLEPNADFCLTLSDDEFLIIKNWQKRDMGVIRVPASAGRPARAAGRLAAGGVGPPRRRAAQVPGRELAGVEEIIKGIEGDRPLVCPLRVRRRRVPRGHRPPGQDDQLQRARGRVPDGHRPDPAAGPEPRLASLPADRPRRGKGGGAKGLIG